ncbi:glycosyltransferase family 4 protein [Cohnella hashimotonis]|uniref:Glycosyltransferase family 4 protein n=1 Tax=Cohnella hashimotonis TaxID=2826895 RepID=A0ABT6TTZ2_9BACL|nr:glycosyltransferase family 4 protein [Cohnella hashimotonis]MDI4650323.1 glycosyltransferase family 4 protein [Cohnella hashimotonis]
MKNVWIIAPFSNIDNIGTRNRFQYISHMLYNEGYKVTLFTSNFNHMKKQHITDEVESCYPFEVKLIPETGYKKNVSLGRVVSHIKHGLNLKRYIKQLEKPHIIYSAYPTMSVSYVAGKYAKKNKIPFIIDIQDTWPESISSAIDTDKLTVRFIMYPFTQLANKIYKMADLVFGVSETYANRANVSGTKCKEFIPVYIGAEIDRFNQNNSSSSIVKNEDDIWISYIGTLSHSYDIETAIRAFSELKEYKNIKLNILGSGPDEKKLRALSMDLGILDTNVFFHGFIQYEMMVSYLQNSDIALNAIKQNAKQTITNKLGDYMSASLPILNSCQETEVLSLVENNRIGMNYKPGNIPSLKGAILDITQSKERLTEYSRNAKKLAEERFNRKESYKVILDKIQHLIWGKI